jgi:hypothetical protein
MGDVFLYIYMQACNRNINMGMNKNMDMNMTMTVTMYISDMNMKMNKGTEKDTDTVSEEAYLVNLTTSRKEVDTPCTQEDVKCYASGDSLESTTYCLSFCNDYYSLGGRLPKILQKLLA